MESRTTVFKYRGATKMGSPAGFGDAWIDSTASQYLDRGLARHKVPSPAWTVDND